MLQAHAGATQQLALQMGSGPVAQWIRHRPTEPGIAGSSPASAICTTRRPAGVICTTRRLRNRPPQTQTNRHRGDSNPCGQSPMDFESISLTARTHCHCKRMRHQLAVAIKLGSCNSQVRRSRRRSVASGRNLQHPARPGRVNTSQKICARHPAQHWCPLCASVCLTALPTVS